MLSVQVLIFQHPRIIKGDFVPFKLTVSQSLLGAVLVLLSLILQGSFYLIVVHESKPQLLTAVNDDYVFTMTSKIYKRSETLTRFTHNHFMSQALAAIDRNGTEQYVLYLERVS